MFTHTTQSSRGQYWPWNQLGFSHKSNCTDWVVFRTLYFLNFLIVELLVCLHIKDKLNEFAHTGSNFWGCTWENLIISLPFLLLERKFESRLIGKDLEIWRRACVVERFWPWKYFKKKGRPRTSRKYLKYLLYICYCGFQWPSQTAHYDWNACNFSPSLYFLLLYLCLSIPLFCTISLTPPPLFLCPLLD